MLFPDLKPLEERFKFLHHNIYKSLPSTRWGSSRDAYAFHRVRVHLDTFKVQFLCRLKLAAHKPVSLSPIDQFNELLVVVSYVFAGHG